MSRVQIDLEAEAARSNWRPLRPGDEVWFCPTPDAAGTVDTDEVRLCHVIDATDPAAVVCAVTVKQDGETKRMTVPAANLLLGIGGQQREQEQLLARCAAFLTALGTGAIQTKLWPEFEALRTELAPFRVKGDDGG